MTEEVIEQYVDTSVLSFLTKSGEYGTQYQALIGDSRIVIPSVVRAELRAYPNWGDARRERLETLLLECVHAPTTEATENWWSLASQQRRDLNLAGSVGDNDLWIIASAAEHSVPLVTHDRRQIAIAQALGVTVRTALPED